MIYNKTPKSIYNAMCKMVGFKIRDRTNNIICEPISTTLLPDFTKNNKNFIEISTDNIFKYAKNNTVNILWSGGIDSTFILCLAIKNNININLFFNVLSVAENPIMFRDMYEGKYKNILSLNIFDRSDDVNNLPYDIVTGHYGDFLLGNIHEYLENDLSSYMVLFQKVIDPFKDNIKCKLDFFTLIHFLLSYDGWDDYNKMYNLKDEKFISFFKENDFQIWTVGKEAANTRSNVTTIRNHKKIFKDYIYTVNNDELYRDRKTKQCSRYLQSGVQEQFSHNYDDVMQKFLFNYKDINEIMKNYDFIYTHYITSIDIFNYHNIPTSTNIHNDKI